MFLSALEPAPDKATTCNESDQDHQNCKKKVLLVEDNPADVYLLMQAMQAHQIDCCLIVAQDGVEARETLQSAAEPIALVLLDLNLPRLDGRSLLSHWSSNGQLKHFPVVVFTSSSAQRERDALLALGARAYLVKPSDLEGFRQVVDLVKAVLRENSPLQ